MAQVFGIGVQPGEAPKNHVLCIYVHITDDTLASAHRESPVGRVPVPVVEQERPFQPGSNPRAVKSEVLNNECYAPQASFPLGSAGSRLPATGYYGPREQAGYKHKADDQAHKKDDPF